MLQDGRQIGQDLQTNTFTSFATSVCFSLWVELVAYRVGAAVGAVAGHWGQESLLANGVGEAPGWNWVSGLLLLF